MAQHHTHFWIYDAETDEHCRDCGCAWDSAEASISCGKTACVNCGEPCDAGYQLCACCRRYDSIVAEYGEFEATASLPFQRAELTNAIRQQIIDICNWTDRGPSNRRPTDPAMVAAFMRVRDGLAEARDAAARLLSA